MSTVPFSMRLDTKLKKRLQKHAKTEKRPASYVVQHALESYLDGLEYERKITDAAFAEFDQGIFVEGEAVHTWMRSWGTDKELPMPKAVNEIDVKRAKKVA